MTTGDFLLVSHSSTNSIMASSVPGLSSHPLPLLLISLVTWVHTFIPTASDRADVSHADRRFALIVLKNNVKPLGHDVDFLL